MKSFVACVMLLFVTTLAFSQSEDTVVVYEDGYDTIAYDEDEYYGHESDTTYSNSTYTQDPGDLNATQKDRNQSYNGKKFSKTEWRKIVGETNYSEDPTQEPEEKDEQAKYRPRSAAWNPALLKIIGYISIILLIGAVIYFLLKSAMLNEPVPQNVETGDPLLRSNQHIDEIRESDIDRLLREALERNDFRAAIRLYYIRLLKHLNSGGYIAWKKDKTNRDYATELSASSFVRQFRKLMIAYEIIWYGERTPSAEEFKKLQGNFIDIQNQSARPA
jgi:hypothetical protein